MASLITLPKFREFIPGTNTPAVGYKVQTFAAGTTTPLATYADAGLTTPNANPTVLDANGECVMYAASGALYKVQYQDNVGTPLWTVDNVTVGGGTGGGSGGASGAEWIASGLTPTFISATQYSFAGDQTGTTHVGRRQRSSNTGGTIYSTITAASFAAGITTVTVANDSGVLDAGLSTVSFGILDSVNTSFPTGAVTAVAVHFGNATTLSSGVGVLLGTTASGGAVDTDVMGEFSTSTGLFTAQRPGRYLIVTSWAPSPTGITYSGFSGIGIEKNAGGITDAISYLQNPAGPPANNNPQANAEILVTLAKGDTIGVRATATFSAGSITYGGGLINIGFIS